MATAVINFYFLFVSEAYQHVRENLTELNGKPEIDETDLVFLKGILDSPAVTQIIKVKFRICFISAKKRDLILCKRSSKHRFYKENC